MNNYLDIIINDDSKSFYIVETDKKPKGDAIDILSKIERVIQEGFSYSPAKSDDAYAKLSTHELMHHLKQKSDEIHSRYTEKEAKLNWLARAIFSHKKEVDLIHTRIGNWDSLPLPNDPIAEVMKYLDAPDIAAYSKVNRHAFARGASAMLIHAQRFGYSGKSETEAKQYIAHLHTAAKKLIRKGIIPKECVVYKPKTGFFSSRKIDVEKTFLVSRLKTCVSFFPIPPFILLLLKSCANFS